MVLYYLLWNYRSRGDATAAGAEALRAAAPESVERNSMRISTEPIIFHHKSKDIISFQTTCV
jgi:hypothetical protein